MEATRATYGCAILHSGDGEAVVVRGVSLDVGAGEIVVLFGRNGMGKTTLIRSIMSYAAAGPTARSRLCRRAGGCSFH